MRPALALALACIGLVALAASGCDSSDNSDACKAGDKCSCQGPLCDPTGDGGNGSDATSSADGGPTTSPPIVCPMAKIEIPGLAEGDSLGSALATDGLVTVIGAPGTAESAGAVHVIARDGCAFIHRGVSPAPGNRGDLFGERVAFAAGTLAVSAPGTETFSSVGTTVSTNYSVGEVFVATMPAAGVPASFGSLGTGYREYDRLGGALAIAADAKTLMIGLPGYEYTQLTPTEVGSAHFMTRATTTDKFVLASSDLYSGENMAQAGSAVAIVSDTVALSGAPGADKVNVFTRDGGQWPVTTSLVPKTPAQGRFGATLVYANDVAFIGAPDEGEASVTGAGAAYVFVRDASGAFTEAQRLAPADRAKDDHFGASIALSNEVLLIGAPNELSGARGGAVYVFQKEGGAWVEKRRLTAPASVASDLFGTAISVASGFAIVGAPGTGSGAIYGLSL